MKPVFPTYIKNKSASDKLVTYLNISSSKGFPGVKLRKCIMKLKIQSLQDYSIFILQNMHSNKKGVITRKIKLNKINLTTTSENPCKDWKGEPLSHIIPTP